LSNKKQKKQVGGVWHVRDRRSKRNVMPYNKKKQEEFIRKTRNHNEAKATWFQIN
jgi:hypothetical protein